MMDSVRKIVMEAGDVKGCREPVLQRSEIRLPGFSTLASDILDQIISFLVQGYLVDV